MLIYVRNSTVFSRKYLFKKNKYRLFNVATDHSLIIRNNSLFLEDILFILSAFILCPVFPYLTIPRNLDSQAPPLLFTSVIVSFREFSDWPCQPHSAFPSSPLALMQPSLVLPLGFSPDSFLFPDSSVLSFL